VHLFRFSAELFSFAFDVLCPCQSSIEIHAKVLHLFFSGVEQHCPFALSDGKTIDLRTDSLTTDRPKRQFPPQWLCAQKIIVTISVSKYLLDLHSGRGVLRIIME
jgi:hypothetical protein